MARRQPDPYAGPTVQGIDVSKWQGEVDWAKVAADPRIKFGISRTGDGKTEDSFFDKNWRASGDAGLVRGSYHYFRADRDGQFQAELVLGMLEKAGGLLPTDLPPALDFEGGVRKNLPGGLVGGTKDLPIDLVVEESLEYLELLESELDVVPLVYTGQAFHWWLSQSRPDLAALFDKYPLWVPSYNNVAANIPANTASDRFPWPHYSIWQYSSKGVVPGVGTPVDINKFRGDEETFKRFIASLHKLPVPPESEHERIHVEMKCHIEALMLLQVQLDNLD